MGALGNWLARGTRLLGRLLGAEGLLAVTPVARVVARLKPYPELEPTVFLLVAATCGVEYFWTFGHWTAELGPHSLVQLSLSTWPL